MKKIVSIIENLPILYGIGVILIYGLSLAEFSLAIMHLFPFENIFINTFRIILGVSYVVNILWGFIIWVIYTLLFHLAAILLGGHATFKRTLFATSYPYIIPACMLFVGILLLDNVPQLNIGITEELLNQNSTILLIKNLISYSFIFYYLSVVVLVRHIYKINYIKSLATVFIPVLFIWLITQLFRWI